MPIIVIDIQAFLNETDAGKIIEKKMLAKLEELEIEFKIIEQELKQEEAHLTNIRPTTESKLFRELGNAFHQKSTEARRAHKFRKTEILTQYNKSRRDLLTRSYPYFAKIMEELKAPILIRKDQAILVERNVDITKRAVAMVNEFLEFSSISNSDQE